ncbi:MAG: hypothetical protein AAB511_03760 [Patescibacteria group bacterium]
MLTKYRKFFLYTIITSLQLVFFRMTYAQGVLVPPGTAIIQNPLQANTLAAFIDLLLTTILPIAALISVFFIIYSGFLMVMAGGNEEKLSKAKMTFLWTVIGIAILLASKVISAVICGTIQQLGTFSLSCITP